MNTSRSFRAYAKPSTTSERALRDYSLRIDLFSILNSAQPYRSDVTDYEKLQATFNKIVSDFGRIDGLYVNPLPCVRERGTESKAV